MADSNMLRYGQTNLQLQQHQHDHMNLQQIKMLQQQQQIVIRQQQQHQQQQQQHHHHHQQQQQQQQPSPPQLPSQLRNPTPFHREQIQIRQQQGNPLGAPPTPGNSLPNSADPTNLVNSQFHIQQQLHLHQAQMRQSQHQASIKQETGSPTFSGSDIDYNDNPQNLLSPSSQSPPNASSPNTQFEDLTFSGFSNQHTQYHPHQHQHPHQQQQQPTQPLQHVPLTQHPSDPTQYPNSPPNGSGPYSPDTNGDTGSEFFDGDAYGVVSPHTSSKGIPVPGNMGMNGGGSVVAGSYTGHGTFGTSPSSLNGQPTPLGQSVPATKGNWFGSLESTNGFSTGQSLTYNANELYGEGDETDAQKNLQQIFERRRKRRESHNAVERRRRDNINEKIHELSTLLPEYMNEGPSSPSSVAAGQRPNKGAILRKSVDHIKNLQSEVIGYQRRVRDLEQFITNIQRNDPTLIAALDIQFMPLGVAPSGQENGVASGVQT